MDEKKEPVALADPKSAQERDNALFDAIGKGKRRKKRRRVIVWVLILALIAGGLYAAVRFGRAKVKERVDASSFSTSKVESYTVDTGSVVTTVSGSGQLTDADTEALRLPDGVKVDEILVHVGQRVNEGDYLATVEPASVMKAMAAVQKNLTELDGKLRTAANEAVPVLLTSNMPGRVKIIYAQAGDDVAACMVEHGALAVLSVDGYMTTDIATDALTAGQEIRALRENGKQVKGTVEKVVNGVATVLVPDNGPMVDEEIAILAADGTELGRGKLSIHEPLRITGYAGTIHRVNCKENQFFNVGYSLFSLRDTAYSANYESVLRQRREAEESLLELLEVYQSGAICAPFTGTVSSIEYKKPANTAQTNPNENDPADPYGGLDPNNTDGQTGGTASTKDESALLTLSKDDRMNVKLTVNETDILALEVGQEAQITINSIGDIFFGQVTEINRNASSESGVTSYTAVVTMPKDPRMLPGMSAKVVVRIQGVENTIQIPEKALHQTRDAAFVYTAYDPETGEFGGAVPVITGLSNGTMIEIVEGLQEGDTVWYTEVFDPWAWSYGSDGDASGGDAWVNMDASGGNAFDEEAFYAEVGSLDGASVGAATDGDAA